MFLVRKKENKDDGKENNRKGVKGGISKAPLIPPKNVHSATVRSGAQSSLRLCSSSVTIKSSSEAVSSHPDKPITQNVELSSNDYSQNELFNTNNSDDSVSSVQQQNIIPSVDVSFPRSSDDHLPLSSVSHDNYHQTSTFHTFPLLKNLPKLSLPALAPVQVNERTLRLQRNFTGDFGFNVRRTQYPDMRGGLRALVFAEPTEVRGGPPRPSEMRTGLLPGDQLVKVNGRTVDSIGREELLSIIQNSGDEVELTVRAMPELAELCDRKVIGSVRDGGDSLMLVPVSSRVFADEDATDQETRYWLMHKNGYTLVRMLSTEADGKVRVRVGDTEMTVDVTDLDKANPTCMDRVENLTMLRYINETSAVHVLRHRYGSSLVHTNAGYQGMICIANEYEPFSCCSDKVVALFKGCRKQQMPPHIYASAQNAYRTMQMTGRSQCMVLTGVSGSGKSTQLRNICHYLCEIAGWTKTLSYDRTSSALDVLEAFGNCATVLSRNATRFANLLTLSFDASASLKYARMQTFLLDTSNIWTASKFHVFYYLLEGADEELKQTLKVAAIDETFYAVLTEEDDKIAAKLGWERLNEAFVKLQVSAAEQRAIYSTLAACAHLCCAQATMCVAQRAQFIRASSAQHAATLLGITLEQLSASVFRPASSQSNAASSVQANGLMNRFSLSNRGVNGPEMLISFITRLYNELFSAVVTIINRGIGGHTSLVTSTSITIIDYPGGNFNAAWTDLNNERTKPSGLIDLTFNYVNERIAELFYESNFSEPIELYAREQVDVDIDKPAQCPDHITRLIDQKQQLMNCVDIELRSEQRRGLLCILDEEALFPGATDDSFFERIFVHLGDSRLIRRGNSAREFVLGHCLGNSPVLYSVDGWVKAAQPGVTGSSVLALLQTSSDMAISALFSPFGIESTSLKMRKATQTVKMDAAGLRMASSGYFSNISLQTDYLISFARRSHGLHFVHCIQAQPVVMANAARSRESKSSSCAFAHRQQQPATISNELVLDVPFVRAQIRALLIVDAVRVASRGYPERLPFKDFRRRFQCLIEHEEESSTLSDMLDDRAAVKRILESMAVFPHTYRLGLSQVLMRSDVLSDLENRREMSLNGVIINLQRLCRKYLATKWLQRRRTLETAIRCIQRNGKCYMKAREWPWWRLYTKCIPLLAAARSDEEYREWERRVRDLEGMVNELRVTKSRLEGRVSELEQMLATECTNTQSLSDALERETELRVQSQKHILLLQQRHLDDQQTPRLSSSSSSHSRFDHDYSRTSELQKEMDTLRASETTQRSRAQKTMERLKDIENELKNVKMRNELLESRNVKFDDEVKSIETKYAKQIEEYEEIVKQRDAAVSSLENKISELQNVKSENNQLQTTVAKLRKEVDEAIESGVQCSEVTQLKKAKRDLEAKFTSQENELDDMAGQIHMLQQNVTRLEMAAERSKNEKIRDLDAKEDEIDELRAQYQRRLRAFEEQIADMQDTNSSLMKQNRILEARLRECDTHNYSYEESSGHYKRELEKAMALLHDTETVLAHERENQPTNQTMIRQLHEQLDDAEAIKLSILKGKHSLESELSEMRTQLETALAAKKVSEARVMSLLKEKNSAIRRAEEHDDQLQLALKNYKEAIQNNSILSIQLNDQLEQLADIEKDKKKLSDKLNEVTTQLEFEQHNSVEKHRLLLAEQKIRDLESKINLEQMSKSRLDSLLAKALDDIENLNERLNEVIRSRDTEVENAKKAHKEAISLGDQLNDMRKREHELVHKCKMATKEMETMEMDKMRLEMELKTAVKRVETLRKTMRNDLECLDEDDDQDVYNNDDNPMSDDPNDFEDKIAAAVDDRTEQSIKLGVSLE